jgi:hypothetical protein
LDNLNETQFDSIKDNNMQASDQPSLQLEGGSNNQSPRGAQRESPPKKVVKFENNSKYGEASPQIDVDSGNNGNAEQFQTMTIPSIEHASAQAKR